MVMKQKNHQENETSNLRQLTSNPGPLPSDIMGKLNNNAIDNGDVKIPTSDFPVESNYESVPYPDTTSIK